ncbi:Calx-beta domain-containing protein [Paenibacillus silvisoli]|uniref:Calx-beta domain-containing protein n=1 Tax=Paenibacillus silvisoli TaxID=3110539 RepID=UPI002805B907|nr:Calx-beta domain-containing protein [Paenibacillus silvisoli]
MLRSSARRVKKVSFLFLAFCIAFLLAMPLQVSAKPNKPPKPEPSKPGILSLSSIAYVTKEGRDSVTITVIRAGGDDGTVSVNYCNCSKTATAGEDFGHVWNTLVFGDGEKVKSFTIPIVNDTKKEGEEGFIVYLKDVTGGATLGLSLAYVSIFDND